MNFLPKIQEKFKEKILVFLNHSNKIQQSAFH